MGSSCFQGWVVVFVCILSLFSCAAAQAHLSTKFYDRSCPHLVSFVRYGMSRAVKREPRMAASILRLFFHDCFTNGCDGSILLDDDGKFISEKDHSPNRQSIRGFEVIDAIKSTVEAVCNATVSCTDILALAAREGVNLVGGPRWPLVFGRRDSRRPSPTIYLPSPENSLSELISSFAAKNLTAQDMTALSGAHTIGQAQCFVFRRRIHGGDANIDPKYAASLSSTCPDSDAGGSNLAALDLQTPDLFDNGYFKDLLARRGLLHSDQELFNGGATDPLVERYSKDGAAFARDFAAAMVKVGNIDVLTGNGGEIRLNCRKVN